MHFTTRLILCIYDYRLVIFIALAAILSAWNYIQPDKFAVRIDRIDKTNNFILAIDNPKISDIKVRVADQKGRVVLPESYADVEKFKKVYNFSNIPKGTYTFSVSNGTQEFKQSIKIFHNDQKHPENGKTITVKFSEYSTGKGLNFVVQNKTGKPVLMAVYNGAGYVIKKEVLGEGSRIEKSLDAQLFSEGTFLVRVGTGENIFCKKVKI